MKNNVVYFTDLRNAGASSADIRSALGCCLRKLSRGVYTVVSRCEVRAHRYLSPFATDSDWMTYHEEGRDKERSQQRRYEANLKRLQVLHYPHYRAGDIVFGISAARLHRIGMFDEPDEPVSVFHPISSTKSPELIRRRRTIAAEDVSEAEGLRVTTPARTALDLRAELGSAAAFAAMEQVVRWHLLGDDEDLIFRLGYPAHLLDEVPGAVAALFAAPIDRLARGAKVAARLVSLASPLSESYLESRAAFNLHLLGLHDFVQQVDIADGRRLLTRLDFLFRDDRVALYVDGTQKYVDGGFDVMNKESRQHNRLLAMGYKIVRFKFNEVLDPKTFGQKLFLQAPELRRRCGKPLVL
ncbi:hypothetical protein [Brevibacterium sediminis]|uniref:hypothetical protein n=1 Tax=Brevibacterium TaxID=1696 RepID=UPI0015E6543D|nr:hypothetical protein [Brevibacterium sediminis]